MSEEKRKPINRRQRLFIEAYLCNGFNATKAAIAAGYSERSARSIGAENLTKPDILAELETYLAEISLSREEILTRLADLARADFANLLTVKEVPDLSAILAQGEQSKPAEGTERPPVPMTTVAELDLLKAVQASQTYAIESVEYGKYGLKVKLHDKLKALELAGRAKGLFREKVEVTGRNGGPIETAAQVVVYIPDNGRDDYPAAAGGAKPLPGEPG